MKFHLHNKDGELVASNLNDICNDCLILCDKSNLLCNCSELKKKRRLGKVEFEKGKIFLCVEEFNSSRRIFKEKAQVCMESIEFISGIKTELKNKNYKNINRLKHNLIEYNAQTLQSIEMLIPEDDLGRGGRNQLQNIKEILKNNNEQAALTFLRILKNEKLVKAEFAAHDILQGKRKLKPSCFPIQKIFYLVFNTFLADFNKKNVSVFIETNEQKVLINYDSISTSFTNILHNTAKYILPGSELKVFFKENDEKLVMIMDMVSVKIDRNETGKIFDEGYSGIYTKNLDNVGNGIGLFIAKQLLLLNKCEIGFKIDLDGKIVRRFECVPYEHNQIHISFIKCK